MKLPIFVCTEKNRELVYSTAPNQELKSMTRMAKVSVVMLVWPWHCLYDLDTRPWPRSKGKKKRKSIYI